MNHDYRVPLVQHVIIPNKNSATTMPPQFVHTGTIYIPNINVSAEKELRFRFDFTPHCSWSEIPIGQIFICASDSTGRTQVKIWKSNSGKAKFELIHDTIDRKYVEVDTLSVIPEQDIVIEVILKDSNINVQFNASTIISTDI